MSNINKKERDVELSKDAIVTLLQFPIASLPYSVSVIVQVHSINKDEFMKYSNYCYTSTLSDDKYRYCGFIFQFMADKMVQCGDIILIQNIIVIGIHKGKERVFFIKKYEILQKNANILQNLPIATNEIVKKFINSKDSINNNNILNKEENEGEMNIEFDDMYNITNKEENGDNKDKDNGDTPLNDDTILEIPKFMNLAELNTFSKNIVLYCKIVKKCELKTFINKLTKQKSKLLSFDLCDPTGFEMQATIFDKSCERFNPLLKEGEIYLIKGGYVKINDKKYTNIKTDFKIIFDYNTIFTHIKKERDTYFSMIIPNKSNLEYIKLSDLPKYQPNSIVDCLVYVIEASNRNTKNTRSGEVSFRRIIVGDISGKKCELTLWKKFSEIEIYNGSYLLLKYIRVNEYNGVRLSTVDDSSIILNPDDKDNKDLQKLKEYINDNNKEEKKWVLLQNDFELKDNNIIQSQTVVNSSITQSNSYITSEAEHIPVYYIREVLDKIGNSCKESPLCKIKATICEVVHSQKNFFGGCPEKQCRKKLIYTLNKETHGDEWYCQGCNKNYSNPYYYYIVSIRVKDVSSECFIDFFGETVTKLFRIKAEEYKNLLSNNDNLKLSEISNRLEYHTFFFVGKANYQVYNNKEKKKFFVYRYEQINQNFENRRLLNNINIKFNLNI